MNESIEISWRSKRENLKIPKWAIEKCKTIWAESGEARTVGRSVSKSLELTSSGKGK
jgi:hypothetical protein